MSRLLIVYRDGLWHVVKEDATSVSLYSTTSSTAASEWRNEHAVHVAVKAA